MNINNLLEKIDEIFSLFQTEGEISIYEDNKLVLNKKTDDSIICYPTYKYHDAFVHILLMMGLNENKIDFNEKISCILKDYKDSNKISFLNLLKDESGIIDIHGLLAKEYQTKEFYTSFDDVKKIEYDTNFRYSIISFNDVMKIINNHQLEHNPGGSNDYNRIMQTLGIYLVEMLYNDTYDNILYNKLFKPLNIKVNNIPKSFLRHRIAYYNIKQTINIDNQNDLFIGLTVNDCNTLYEALNKGLLIPLKQVKLMKKLSPFVGISFYNSYSFAHNFSLGDFEVFELKNKNLKVIYNTSFNGYAVNINNELHEFDNYIISNIIPYFSSYNKPKLVKLNKNNVYELLEIINTEKELWFMGPTKYMLAYQYVEKNVTCYLLTDNGITVGTVSLYIDKKNQKYDINNVLVDKRYQSKGYGKALINESLKIFKENDVKSLILFVEKSNEKALKTYLGCGFKLKASYISNYELVYEF